MGSHVSGSGNTSALRWREYACAFTLVFAGILSYPTSLHVGNGVTRGWIPGMEAWSRNVSVSIASRRGKESMDFGDGSSGAADEGG